MVNVENPNAQVHSAFPTPIYVTNLGHDLTPKMLNYLNNQEFLDTFNPKMLIIPLSFPFL